MTAAFARLAAALADRCRLERQLGAGGMATVHLALDLKHHRRVAIKVLRPELAAAIGPERFLREIETTAALHHPHILAAIALDPTIGRHRLTLAIRARPMHLPRPHDSHP